jgi:hypothetical protein
MAAELDMLTDALDSLGECPESPVSPARADDLGGDNLAPDNSAPDLGGVVYLVACPGTWEVEAVFGPRCATARVTALSFLFGDSVSSDGMSFVTTAGATFLSILILALGADRPVFDSWFSFIDPITELLSRVRAKAASRIY